MIPKLQQLLGGKARAVAGVMLLDEQMTPFWATRRLAPVLGRSRATNTPQMKVEIRSIRGFSTNEY